MQLRFATLFLSSFLLFWHCAPRSGAQDETSSDAHFDALFEVTDYTAEGLFTPGIEGPASDSRGVIYAVNFSKESTIGKVDINGNCSLLVELPAGSTGNGIRIGGRGNLFLADYTGHNVLKIDPATKAVDVYAHDPNMNQPNDLAIMQSGILFASDPNWKEGTGNLWRVNLDGTTTLLEEGMGTTNGVEVSPDEKTLYVNESVQLNIWAYDLSSDGDISNKRLIHQFPDFGMDGQRCDEQGNLFITRHGKGTVVMLSPLGEILEEITLVGKKPSNIAFGGPDGRTCFVTLQDRGCFEKFRVPFKGRSFNLHAAK